MLDLENIPNVPKSTNLIQNKPNILKENLDNGICVFICVMNRIDNIKKNIYSWLKQNIHQLIIYYQV